MNSSDRNFYFDNSVVLSSGNKSGNVELSDQKLSYPDIRQLGISKKT